MTTAIGGGFEYSKSIFTIGVALLLFAVCGLTPTQAQDAGVTGYYVRADGNDSNTGISENAPFRTLARAVEAASTTTVKTITVIGTLAGQTEINNSGSDEILITGKPNASDSEKAVLTTSTDERIQNTLKIDGNSNIKFEYITITTAGALSVIYIQNTGATLTLGRDTVVFNIERSDEYRPNYGGGILIVEGTLVMRDNAMVINSRAGAGGGAAVFDGGTLIMQDNAIISNNIALSDHFDYGGGGGIYCLDGSIILRDNAKVTRNQANHGGGIVLRFSSIRTADNLQAISSGVYESRQVTGNTATGEFLGGHGGDNIRVHNH